MLLQDFSFATNLILWLTGAYSLVFDLLGGVSPPAHFIGFTGNGDTFEDFATVFATDYNTNFLKK